MVVTAKQDKKITRIENSKINKVIQNRTDSNYWSPLTHLVEEWASNDNSMKADKIHYYIPTAINRAIWLNAPRSSSIKKKQKEQRNCSATVKDMPRITTSESASSVSKNERVMARTNMAQTTTSKLASSASENEQVMARTTTTTNPTISNSNISESERRNIGSELASTVSQLEDEMNKILDEFNRMDNSIEQILTIAEKNSGVADGIYDCAATSGVAAVADIKDLVPTGEQSNKVFIIPNSEAMPATKKYKLGYKLRGPATEMTVVPGVNSSLISACKFADADYITVLEKNGLKIYDGKTTIINYLKTQCLVDTETRMVSGEYHSNR